jgi:hypothetical protein
LSEKSSKDMMGFYKSILLQHRFENWSEKECDNSSIIPLFNISDVSLLTFFRGYRLKK